MKIFDSRSNWSRDFRFAFIRAVRVARNSANVYLFREWIFISRPSRSGLSIPPPYEDYQPRFYNTVIVRLFCNSAIFAAAELLGGNKSGKRKAQEGEIGWEANLPRQLHGPAACNFAGLFLERAWSSHSGTGKLYNRLARAISPFCFTYPPPRFFLTAMRFPIRIARRSTLAISSDVFLRNSQPMAKTSRLNVICIRFQYRKDWF